jgi:hypothetical protein
MPSDNYNGLLIDDDFFDHMDVDSMNMDVFDASLLHMQSGPPNHPLLPATMMDDRCLEILRSHTGVPSSSSASLPHFDEVTWDIGIQEHSAETPPLSFQSNKSLRNTSQQSYNSLSTVPDSSLHRRRRLQHIEPRPTSSSTNAMRGSEPQGIKKSGRRRGPLNAEQRREASQIRKIRACTRCKMRKTKVSWKIYPWSQYCFNITL